MYKNFETCKVYGGGNIGGVWHLDLDDLWRPIEIGGCDPPTSGSVTHQSDSQNSGVLLCKVTASPSEKVMKGRGAPGTEWARPAVGRLPTAQCGHGTVLD